MSERTPRKCGQCHKCLEGQTVTVGDGLVIPVTATRMVLCETCGCKRCPHATDCSLACTESNEPGQPGSIYAAQSRLAEMDAAGQGQVNSGERGDSGTPLYGNESAQATGESQQARYNSAPAAPTAPPTESAMPEPARYNQMGSAMVACHDTFTGKPAGAWIDAKDYDALRAALDKSERELAEALQREREANRILKIISECEVTKDGKYIQESGKVLRQIAINHLTNSVMEDAIKQHAALESGKSGGGK